MVAELGAVKAAQSFDVEMEQTSGMRILVTTRGRRGIERAQAVQSKTAQNAADGGAAETGMLCNAKTGPALPAQRFHLGQQKRDRAPRRGVRPGGAIGHGLPAALAVTAPPLGGGFRTDVEGGGRRLPRQSFAHNSLRQSFSTKGRQSCILVNVHSISPECVIASTQSASLVSIEWTTS
jgi:hypothetical protein